MTSQRWEALTVAQACEENAEQHTTHLRPHRLWVLGDQLMDARNASE